MYINSLVVRATKVKNSILLAVGITGLIIFGATGICVLLEDGASELDMVLAFFLLTALCIFAVYRCVKSRKLLDSIFFYSRYFEGDLDGYIYTSDMVKVIGKNEADIDNELKKLLKRKYMTNFILRDDNNKKQVVLASKIGKCECKNCGAVIEKRIYFTGICPYCSGSDLYAKLIK